MWKHWTYYRIKEAKVKDTYDTLSNRLLNYIIDNEYYEVQILEGVDASIEISLKEYGFAWKETENGYIIFYGINKGMETDNFGCTEESWIKFDWLEIEKELDIYSEYDWVDFESIYSSTGTEKEDWDKQDLIYKMYDLFWTWGSQIGGENYGYFMTYNDIIINDYYSNK